MKLRPRASAGQAPESQRALGYGGCAGRLSQQPPSTPGHHSADGTCLRKTQHQLTEQPSLRSAFFPGSPAIWQGWAAVLLGPNNSYISPQDSSLWDFALAWGSHVAAYLAFHHQCKHSNVPNQSRSQSAAFPILGALVHPVVLNPPKCRIPCAAAAASGWALLSVSLLAHSSLGSCFL